MKSGVYMIVCSASGSEYIGSSINMKKRVQDHFKGLRNGTHQNVKIQRAWDKYGEDAFHWSVMEETLPEKDVLLSREQHYIDTRAPVLNICPVAGSRLGAKCTTEFREIQRANSEEVWTRSGHREKIQEKARGRKQTPEHVEKRISKTRGQPMAQYQRDQIGQHHTGNKYNLGRVWTEEQREAARQRSLAQWSDTDKKMRILRSRGIL